MLPFFTCVGLYTLASKNLRVKFKILLNYKAVHGLAPSYMTNLTEPYQGSRMPHSLDSGSLCFYKSPNVHMEPGPSAIKLLWCGTTCQHQSVWLTPSLSFREDLKPFFLPEPIARTVGALLGSILTCQEKKGGVGRCALIMPVRAPTHPLPHSYSFCCFPLYHQEINKKRKTNKPIIIKITGLCLYQYTLVSSIFLSVKAHLLTDWLTKLCTTFDWQFFLGC